MIQSTDLLDKVKDILGKDKVLESDFSNVEDLTLNKYKFNGKENDIDLSELRYFKNLKTLTLINFQIDKEIIKSINDNDFLWAIQFSSCKFKDIIPVKQEVDYLILDYCENINLELINNNKTVKIIGSEVDLKQLKQMDKIESLYLQDCKIKNTEEILKYKKLKLLNLDGSILENNDILKKLYKNIKIYYKDEYHPVGGM